MKVISTLGIVLSSSIIAASAEVSTQKSGEDCTEARNQKDIDVCEQNLVAIGKAIEAYKKEHGDFPEWLSELHPKYLSDASLLLCPADKGSGKPIFFSQCRPKNARELWLPVPP